MINLKWYKNSEWLITKPFRLQRGCDEFHNKSIYLEIPGIGCICLFLSNKRGKEHLYGVSGNKTFGAIYEDCEICSELLDEYFDATGNRL